MGKEKKKVPYRKINSSRKNRGMQKLDGITSFLNAKENGFDSGYEIALFCLRDKKGRVLEYLLEEKYKIQGEMITRRFYLQPMELLEFLQKGQESFLEVGKGR